MLRKDRNASIFLGFLKYSQQNQVEHWLLQNTMIIVRLPNFKTKQIKTKQKLLNFEET